MRLLLERCFCCCYSLAMTINIPQIHDEMESMQKEQMCHYPLSSCLIVKVNEHALRCSSISSRASLSSFHNDTAS